MTSDALDSNPGRQELFWLTGDGTWYQDAADTSDLLGARLHLAAAQIEALGTSLLEQFAEEHAAMRGRPPRGRP